MAADSSHVMGTMEFQIVWKTIERNLPQDTIVWRCLHQECGCWQAWLWELANEAVETKLGYRIFPSWCLVVQSLNTKGFRHCSGFKAGEDQRGELRLPFSNANFAYAVGRQILTGLRPLSCGGRDTDVFLKATICISPLFFLSWLLGHGDCHSGGGFILQLSDALVPWQ